MAKKKATKKKPTKKAPAKKKVTRKLAKKHSSQARKPAPAKKSGARADTRVTHDYEGWESFTVQQKRIIRAYEHLPIPTKVCSDVGASRGAFYKWMREKPLFKEAIERAGEISVSNAEAVAMELGVLGRNELQIANGQVVMSEFDENGNRYGKDEDGNSIAKPVVRRVHDTGLIKLVLGAKKPDEYGSKRVQVTGKDGGAVKTQTTLVSLTEEQTKQLPEEVLEKIAQQGLDEDE